MRKVTKAEKERFPLQVSPAVTLVQAARFAEMLFDQGTIGAIVDARVITRPDGADLTPAARVYHRTVDTFAEEIEAIVQPVAVQAFKDAAARVLGVPAESDVSDERLVAIREFFTAPKDRYAEDEVRKIFGRDYPSDCAPIEARADVAEFLLGYVPPTVIGRAVAGLDAGPLTNETRAIELPRWIWEALDSVAADGREPAGDVLSYELLSNLEGVGVGCDLRDASEIPNYATARIGEVSRAAAERTADQIDAEAAPSGKRRGSAR